NGFPKRNDPHQNSHLEDYKDAPHTSRRLFPKARHGRGSQFPGASSTTLSRATILLAHASPVRSCQPLPHRELRRADRLGEFLAPANSLSLGTPPDGLHW